MAAKKTMTVPKPVYELGQEVFTVATLQKGEIFQQVLITEKEQESPVWLYRLGFPDGQVSQGLFNDESLCLKDAAKEIFEQKKEQFN